MSEVVEVEADEARCIGRLSPRSGEVAAPERCVLRPFNGGLPAAHRLAAVCAQPMSVSQEHREVLAHPIYGDGTNRHMLYRPDPTTKTSLLDVVRFRRMHGIPDVGGGGVR